VTHRGKFLEKVRVKLGERQDVHELLAGLG
jgi:hypothetical protein